MRHQFLLLLGLLVAIVACDPKSESSTNDTFGSKQVGGVEEQPLRTGVRSTSRIALVIGNNHYFNLPDNRQLSSPVADAQEVAAALAGHGYTLATGAALIDASQQRMAEAVESFKMAAQGAEAAVFYFSGHGVQMGEDNYLLPSDTPRLTGFSTLASRAIHLQNSVMVGLEEAGAQTKVIILDCCRDNPFSAQLETALAQVGKSIKTKSVGEITGYGPGFYLAFATSPGHTADDGNGQRHSPFTAAFLQQLPHGAGKDIDFFFRDVKTLLGDSQVAWTNHSLRNAFSFVLGDSPEPSQLGVSHRLPHSVPDSAAMVEVEQLKREVEDLKKRTQEPIPAPARQVASPPPPRTTKLTVTSDPLGATVSMAGQILGTTPLRESDLPPGEQTLRISKEGYGTKTLAVILRDGEPEAVAVTLVREVNFVGTWRGNGFSRIEYGDGSIENEAFTYDITIREDNDVTVDSTHGIHMRDVHERSGNKLFSSVERPNKYNKSNPSIDTSTLTLSADGNSLEYDYIDKSKRGSGGLHQWGTLQRAD